MAARKPAIGFGPISDDLLKALIKKASGASGRKSQKRANSIINRLEKRNPVIGSAGWSSANKARGGAGKLNGQLARSKTAKAERALTADMQAAHIKKQAKSAASLAAERKSRAAAAKRAARKSGPSIDSAAAARGRAQRAIESNAAKNKLIRSYDKRLNRIDLAEKRGAGKVTKSRSTGKPTVYGQRGQAAERSKAGAIQGGTRAANIRAKAKSDELKAAIRAERDPKARAALREKAKKHRDKTGF